MGGGVAGHHSWMSSFLGAPVWLDRLGQKERHLGVALLVFAVALWLIARGFPGIRHDGTLYLAQALMQRYPDSIGADMFFAYGSQDQFTIYSPLYAWLADMFGWSAIMPVLVMVCQLAFLASLVYVLRACLPLPLLALGIVVAATSPYYGGYSIFSYGEPFLTGRSFAEPLVLLGMGLLARQRLLASLLPLFGGMLFHPLMALPGFGVAYLLWAQRYPRAWWLVVVVPAGLLAAWLDVPGLAGLVAAYDDVWRSALVYTDFVFPHTWRAYEWAKILFDVFVLWMAARVLVNTDRPAAELLRAVLLIAALGLLAGAVGAGVLQLQLFTQAQLWRAQWLSHLLACAVFPWLIWRLRDRGVLLWAGVMLVIAGLGFRVQDAALLAMVLGGTAMAVAMWRKPVMTPWFKAFTILFTLAILIAGLVNDLTFQAYRVQVWDISSPIERLRPTLQYVFTSYMMVVAFLVLVVRFPRFSLILSGLALAIGVATWDRRGDWDKFVMDSVGMEAHPFVAGIAPDAQIYWTGDLVAPWMLLNRPSYYTPHQASGLLFNRETAIEFLRRRALVVYLESQAQICREFGSLISNCRPDPEVIVGVCAAKGGPDYIVLPEDVPLPQRARWDARKHGGTAEFILYDCAVLRGLPSPLPPEMTYPKRARAVTNSPSGAASAKPRT